MVFGLCRKRVQFSSFSAFLFFFLKLDSKKRFRRVQPLFFRGVRVFPKWAIAVISTLIRSAYRIVLRRLTYNNWFDITSLKGLRRPPACELKIHFFYENTLFFKDRYINIEEKEFEDNLWDFLFDVFEGYINH